MKDFKGSMTIEAAVIVPAAMVIMVSVIYLGYFVHDQAAFLASTHFEVMENAGKANTENLTGKLNSKLASKAYESSGITVSADNSKGKISAVSEGSFNAPLNMIRSMLGYGTDALRASVSVSCLDSRRKLLLYKSICDGVPELLKEMK